MIALFIAPTIICLLLMYLYPITRTVIMSFFHVESVTAAVSEWSFNGLENYLKIFHNASFIASMKNMMVIWLVGGVISLTLAMIMAVILTSGIRGAKFFKGTGKSGSYGMWNHPRGHVWNVFVRPASA